MMHRLQTMLISGFMLTLALSGLADSKMNPEAAANPFAKKTWRKPVRPKVEAPKPPEAPPLEFVCFGRFVDEKGRLMVFLQKGEGGPIFLVTTGDMLDGVYRVESIQDNLINLRYLPLGLMQTLRMNGDVS